MAGVLDVEFLAPRETPSGFHLGKSCFDFIACIQAKGRSEKSTAANPQGGCWVLMVLASFGMEPVSPEG